jgi:hypothetical protein
MPLVFWSIMPPQRAAASRFILSLMYVAQGNGWLAAFGYTAKRILEWQSNLRRHNSVI